jgi:hypothetical protein
VGKRMNSSATSQWGMAASLVMRSLLVTKDRQRNRIQPARPSRDMRKRVNPSATSQWGMAASLVMRSLLVTKDRQLNRMK